MKRGILFLSLALLFVPFVSFAQNNNEVTGAMLITTTDSIVTQPTPTPPVEKKAKVKKEFKTIEVKKGYQQEVSLAYSWLDEGGPEINQLNFNYVGGYRFNHYFYAGIGTGLDFAASHTYKPMTFYDRSGLLDWQVYESGDKIRSSYNSFRHRNLPIQKVSIPLYVHLRAYFMKTKWAPFIAFSAGIRISAPKKLGIYDYEIDEGSIWSSSDDFYVIKNHTRTEMYGTITGMFEVMPGVNYQYSKNLGFNFQFGFAARSGHRWDRDNNFNYNYYTAHYASQYWYNGITMRLGVTF